MIDPTLSLAILVSFATLMALITAGLVKWAAEARTRTSVAVVLFLLVMMIAMLGGALLYFLHPGTASLVAALWFASAAMSVSVFPVFAVFLQDARRRLVMKEAYAPAPLQRRHLFAASILGLVVLNEFLMGWTFQLAAGTLSASRATSAATALALGVNSPWFLFPMALEMGLSAFLLRGVLPRRFAGLLITQAALMFVSPPAFSDPTAAHVAVGIGSALMIGIVIFVLEHIYRHRQDAPVVSGYFLGLLAIYALMMAGLYQWLVYGSGLLFAVSVVLEMALFFDVVVVPERFKEEKGVPWTLRPHWTFALLSVIFVAEAFMGAVLDILLEPSYFAGAFQPLPLSGSGATILSNAVSNGFWWLDAVTASTWFLLMMGVEMGTLVVFKIVETRSRETRIRLALMLGSYGVFVVWFPSIYYPMAFPGLPSGTAVPVLGWSMGLGSAAIAPSLFTVIFATYGIWALLSLLFGRRWVCSVFCMAPTMYQGTTIDAMSSFNRSSPLGRKYLSSRFSGLYSVTTGTVMASLVGVSLLSYFDQVGLTHVLIAGADPSVFLYDLSFNVMWYLIFVTIPYTGNYSCVTMGWCYTGIITGAFGRLGFFDLRVRDREVCKRCTTLDCAKKCPVGLVDMPGHFRQKGRFRSSKCCGVGDCAEACPYGNLYLHDVRHWVRERLAARRTPPAGTLLPMVPRAHAPPTSEGTEPRSPVPAGRSSGAHAVAPGPSPPA